jgi:hypothetical protein
MRAVSIQSPSSSRSAIQDRTTAERDWIKASSKATFSAAHASSGLGFGFVMALSFVRLQPVSQPVI